jgi:23S rRNA (pseudouridine1915-N3)-methyltransferase
MKIAILQTGKTTDRHISEVAEMYTGRIKKYSIFEIITLPDLKNTKNLSVQEQTLKEGRKILQALRPEDYVILLEDSRVFCMDWEAINAPKEAYNFCYWRSMGVFR